MSRADEPWTVDRVTVRLLHAIPTLRAQVLAALEAGPSFMDVIGKLVPSEGQVESITIHAWTPNKVIMDMRFHGGWCYADEQLKMRGSVPESIIATYMGQDCSRLIGHACFEGQKWCSVNRDDEFVTLRMKPLERLELGHNPAAALARLIAEEEVYA